MKKTASNNFCAEAVIFAKKWSLQMCALFLFACFFLGDSFEKNFAAVGSIGSLLIGYAAYQISREQKEGLNYKMSSDERDTFRRNYKKLKDAITRVTVSGKIDHDTFRLFCEADSEAKLEIPQDIQEYVGEIFEISRNLLCNSIHLRSTKNGGLPEGKERSEISKKQGKLILEIMKKKPETIYSRYMQISK